MNFLEICLSSIQNYLIDKSKLLPVPQTLSVYFSLSHFFVELIRRKTTITIGKSRQAYVKGMKGKEGERDVSDTTTENDSVNRSQISGYSAKTACKFRKLIPHKEINSNNEVYDTSCATKNTA